MPGRLSFLPCGFLVRGECEVTVGEGNCAAEPARRTNSTIRWVEHMDAELSALEARRNKTRQLAQAMMQELLTGRTRLV